jgi:hypothetical protein
MEAAVAKRKRMGSCCLVGFFAFFFEAKLI